MHNGVVKLPPRTNYLFKKIYRPMTSHIILLDFRFTVLLSKLTNPDVEIQSLFVGRN